MRTEGRFHQPGLELQATSAPLSRTPPATHTHTQKVNPLATIMSFLFSDPLPALRCPPDPCPRGMRLAIRLHAANSASVKGLVSFTLLLLCTGCVRGALRLTYRKNPNNLLFAMHDDEYQQASPASGSC